MTGPHRGGSWMRALRCAALVCVLILPSLGRADEPKYEYKDVTAATPPPVPKWAFKANMTFGLVWVAGNAESLGVSGTGLLSARRGDNEWSLTGGGAYVRSGVSSFGKGEPITSTQT